MSNPERRPPVQAMTGWTPVAVSQLDSRTARAVETLERRAPLNIKKASRAGVGIKYLGIAPLFSEPIACLGELTNWVVSPVPYGNGYHRPGRRTGTDGTADPSRGHVPPGVCGPRGPEGSAARRARIPGRRECTGYGGDT